MPDTTPTVAATIIRHDARWQVTAVGTGRGGRMFDAVCLTACPAMTARPGDIRQLPCQER